MGKLNTWVARISQAFQKVGDDIANLRSGKEDKSNKVTSFHNPNNTTYPTTLAIINEILEIQLAFEMLKKQYMVIALNHGEAEEGIYPVFSSFQYDITITSMILVSRDDVTGLPLISDLLINNTNVTGGNMTIPTSSRESNVISGLAISKGDNVDLDVSQVGNILTGENLMLYIEYKKD